MLSFAQTLMLFADATKTRQVMQAFRSAKHDESMNNAWLSLMLVAAGLATVVAVYIFVRDSWQKRMSLSPRGLFNELCRAHRLKWSQRRLLWRLAKSQNLPNPAALFLTPDCFTIGRLTAEIRPHAEELHKLSERIFAETHEEEKSKQAALADSFRDGEKPTAALPLSPIPPTLEIPQWNLGVGSGMLEQK